jgi:hypothetical protein
VFPVRYGLNFYILFRGNSVFKGLSVVLSIRLQSMSANEDSSFIFLKFCELNFNWREAWFVLFLVHPVVVLVAACVPLHVRGKGECLHKHGFLEGKKLNLNFGSFFFAGRN